MKKLFFLIALLFSVSIAEAQQTSFVRNDSAATTLSARNNQKSIGSVDSTGSIFTRSNDIQDTAALVSAVAATTTQTGADQTNIGARGVTVVLDMTVVGTGSVTLEIDGKDAASGKYYALLTSAAITTNSTNVFQLYPGVTVAANAAVSSALPRIWRVKVTANNANPTTYTVGASLIR